MLWFTGQLKLIEMPSIQNLKFSFKVYSRIFPTFQKMNYDKLKQILEIHVISTPKKKPFKYRKVVKELSERSDIAILKADKVRGVVIMNRDRYTGICLQMLNTNQFVKLISDPAKTTERKVRNVLRKIKSKFSPNEYKQLYPTGTSPDKFCGKNT